MFYKLMGLATAAGLALSLGTIPANAQKAAENMAKPLERECKAKEVSRTGGRSRFQITARKKARDAWRQKIREREGKQWASWLFSKDAKYNCFKEKGRNRCTVIATPCKLTAVLSGPGKVCSFYKIAGTGNPSKLKEWAKHKARKVWAARVRDFYGTKMDTWLLSNSKDTKCTDHANGTHTCTVTSQPCRFRVLN